MIANPFTALPGQVAPRTRVQEQKRKLGLLPMAPGSQHQITIRIPGKPTLHVHTTARPFDSAPGAKTIAVCLHHTCNEMSWPDEVSMRKDERHKHEDMQRSLHAHVWGYWSTDPADPTAPKMANCEACKKEKGDAPCAEHRGPVLGLIAPEQAAPAE